MKWSNLNERIPLFTQRQLLLASHADKLAAKCPAMMLIAHTENYFTPILTRGPLRPTSPVQGVQRRAGCHSYFMISAYESTVPQSSGPGQQDFDKAERENERAY